MTCKHQHFILPQTKGKIAQIALCRQQIFECLGCETHLTLITAAEHEAVGELVDRIAHLRRMNGPEFDVDPSMAYANGLRDVFVWAEKVRKARDEA